MARVVPEGPWPSVKKAYQDLMKKYDTVGDNKKRAVLDYWTGLLMLERSKT